MVYRLLSLSEQDIPSILYLYYRINGFDKGKFKHIVVDESQDLSPFELYSLKGLSDNQSFTIVGDINQSIIPFKGINSQIAKNVFESANNLKTYNLTRSYRSTYEIVMLSNELIKNNQNEGYIPTPIKRYGDKPLLIGRKTDEEIEEEILKYINIKANNIKNVAVILKTEKACQALYEKIKDKVSINLVSDSVNEYKGGISIIPAYLVKGLEFDLVIIADADNINYDNNDLNRNLLYVQITRALHKLVILYKDNITPLLEGISSEYIEEEETERDKLIRLKLARETLLALLKMKFGDLPQDIEKRIWNEKDYKNIQSLITKAAIVDNIEQLLW